MYWYQKIAVFDKEGFCFSMLKLKELSGVFKSNKIKCFIKILRTFDPSSCC